MRSDKRNHTLDDLLTEARNVPSVLSDEKIDSIIDARRESGRRSPHWSTTSRKRQTIMNTIALIVAASSLGIGILYVTPHTTEPATNIAVTYTAPRSASQVPGREEIAAQHPTSAPNAITSSAHHRTTIVSNAADNHQTDNVLPKEEGKELADKFEQQLAHDAAEYWIARINSYKTQIDNMLSASDLVSLNKLRVRWEILKSDNLRHNGFLFNVADPADSTMKNKLPTVPKGSVSMQVWAHRSPTTDSTITAVQSMYTTAENGELQPIETDKPADMATMLSMLKMVMAQDNSEKGTITNSAREISSRYEAQMTDLRGTVIHDFVTFLSMVSDRTRDFVREHKADLQQNGLEPFIDREELINGSQLMFGSIDDSNTTLAAIYDLMVEPELLLYNGSEVSNLISDAVIGPVTGMKLPENGVLQQSFPNPAVSNVSIAYTLNEPSSSTLIRIYDATGNIVLTNDEGARSTGHHTMSLDLSGLPNGTYLYQLHVTTSQGDRVFSKTLQVVH